MIDAQVERNLQAICEDCRQMYGGDLVSVAVYGSAAGPDFVPGQSDLNLVIVVDSLRLQHLDALQSRLPSWHQRGAATPLLLDRPFFRRANDVFPIEFEDIHARHRILFGEDLYGGIVIDAGHLRLQLEQEARGKLMRLRIGYAETAGDQGHLESLMLQSVKSFLTILRSLLRWRSDAEPVAALDLLTACGRDLKLDLPSLRELVEIKLGRRKFAGDRRDLFARYLADVERLVDTVDRVELS